MTFVLLPEEVLTKRQRNDLYRVLEDSGAPVTDFVLGTVHGDLFAADKDHDVKAIIHSTTDSYFAVRREDGNTCSIVICLGTGKTEAQEDVLHSLDVAPFRKPHAISKHAISKCLFIPIDGGGTIDNPRLRWPDVLKNASLWARVVNRWAADAGEFEHAPDLWAETDHSRSLLAGAEDNTLFSAPEQAEVSDQIKQFKDYIKATYELTAEQIAEVDERFDQVDQASRRMGRKDWLMLFDGAVFSLVLTDAIPQQAVQHILVMALHGLGHLFGIGGVPSQLGHG